MTVKASSTRKLVINFILLSCGEALSKVLAFFAFAYLARILGPERYGSMEFALAVTLFLNLAVEGGLGLLGAREIAKSKRSLSSLTFHVVTLRLILAVGMFLILALFTAVIHKSWQEKQLLLLYGFTLFATPGLLQWVFQGLDRMHWVALSSVIRWTCFAALVFIFINDPQKLWIVPLLELVAIMCVVLLNIGVFRYSCGRLWQGFDASYGLSLLRQALPICLTQLMWGLKIYLPLIMLGLMVGGNEVGWFGAAHRIVIAIHTFVWMYFFNIYPSISRCSLKAHDQLEQLVGKSLQVTSWLAVFIGVTGMLYAGPLIVFVYGPEFDEATVCLKILIWLIAFTLISSHFMYTLIAYNKQWLELLSSVCGAIMIFLLSILLIPKYGFTSAAWALICSEALIWILNYNFVRRDIINIQFWRYLIKPFIVGMLITAIFMFFIEKTSYLAMSIAVIFLYVSGMMFLQPGIIKDVRMLISGNK